MDEPFSSVDAGLRGQLRAEVRAILKEREATVVLVTHDQEEAMQLADRVAVMNEGRIEQLGSPEQVFDYPDTRFAAEFFGTAGLPGHRHRRPAKWRDSAAGVPGCLQSLHGATGSTRCNRTPGLKFA